MKYGIYIGATKETITEAKGAILDVLNAPHADEKTKQLALKAFSKAVSCDYATVSNCNIVSEQREDVETADSDNDFDGEIE